MSTPFKTKCEILSELWMTYRNEETLKDFFEYNDLSLPLAFLLAEGIVSETNSVIEGFIEESFIIFLTAMKIEDEGFDNLDEIITNFFDEGDDLGLDTE
jgi:hypothetical protein